MTRFPIILIIFFSCLVGCTTAEYRMACQDCSVDALRKYPEKLKNISANRTRYESVPDGNISCSSRQNEYPTWRGVVSRGSVYTTCTQGTRRLAIPYTETSTVEMFLYVLNSASEQSDY